MKKLLLALLLFLTPTIAYGSLSYSANLVRASTQYFSATSASSLNPGSNNFTLEGWYYFPTTPSSGANYGLAGKSDTVGNNREYRWSLANNAGVLQLELTQNSDGTSGTNGTVDVNWTPQVNTWFHLAVVYTTAGDATFYVATSTGSANPTHVQVGATQTGLNLTTFNGTAPFLIGVKSVDDTANTLNGNASMVRMWTASRSSAQLDSASCTLLGSTSNLGGEWSLDNALTDNSGNSNTLTNVNSATFQAKAPASCLTGNVKIFLTTGTTFTVPSNWNNASNSIEVIGGGAGGGGATTDAIEGGGGGAGAYSKISNLTLTPDASVTYQGGAAGAGGAVETDGTAGTDSFFNRTSGTANTCADTSSVCAKAGAGGALTGDPGVGGASGSGIGTTKNSGGDGGGNSGAGRGGAGGGAASINGIGGAGGTQSAGNGGAGGGGSGGGTAGSSNIVVTGGAGGNNSSGSGGGAAHTAGTNGGGGGGGNGASDATRLGGVGGNGTEWDSTHGSGGGGGETCQGALCNGATLPGANGGLYGGGGAGGGESNDTEGEGGNGGKGIIVISYTPASTPSSTRNPAIMIYFGF